MTPARPVVVLVLALMSVLPLAAQELTVELQGVRAGAGEAVPPAGPRVGTFVAGFNQAWLGTAYGNGWLRGFDEAEARRLLAATRTFGGSVLRMWLFEGLTPEGVIWDGDPARSAWDYAGKRTRPTGLDPAKVAAVERFLVLAEEEGVAVYFTFFDGNIYAFDAPHKDRRRDEWWNVLNDDYGAGTGFLTTVVAPLAEVWARHPSAVFGLDLCNEINALVKNDWFRDGWDGARRFVGRWRAFVRRRAPIPVTASFGHHDAVDRLLDGSLSAGTVDFLDFHAYDDEGRIRREAAVASFVRSSRLPVVLGEFGQKSSAFDSELQSRSTVAFLTRSRRLGLAGALAWRLSDIRPGHNAEARLSFEAFGRWRPAAAAFRSAVTGP